VRTPRAWPWAWVPTLVLLLLLGLLVHACVAWLQPAIRGWLPEAESGIGRVGASALSWLATALAALLGALLALAATPPLCAPALERIVGLAEDEAGVARRQPIGWLREMWCGLRAQLASAVVAAPLVSIFWVVELLFPPAAVVTLPLKLLVVSLALAWNLFDYPLTLRGVRIRERVRLLGRSWRIVLGLGAVFAVLFWLPCFNVALLPLGVAGATRVLWRVIAADPDALPVLRQALPAAASSDPPQSRAGGGSGSTDR
jgi:CysZ protein